MGKPGDALHSVFGWINQEQVDYLNKLQRESGYGSGGGGTNGHGGSEFVDRTDFKFNQLCDSINDLDNKYKIEVDKLKAYFLGFVVSYGATLFLMSVLYLELFR